MSADAVLYDVPGPRARRRALIGTVIATLAILAVLGLVVKRLNDQGQFSMELWGPLIDPSNASFMVKSAQCHSSWISGGPPGCSGFVNAFSMSWMCGMFVSFTGNGHVIPTVLPNQR